MADIDIERRSGGSVWAWIIGLLLLAALIWALVEVLDTDEAEVVEPVATAPAVAPVMETEPAVAPEPIAAAAGIPVSQIVASPATYTGQTLAGEVRVAEVVSDRGFWIEDQGQRLFVVLNEGATETMQVQAGQSLRLAEAMVHTDAARVPGDLEQQARSIAMEQPAFLAVDPVNVQMVQGAGSAM